MVSPSVKGHHTTILVIIMTRIGTIDIISFLFYVGIVLTLFLSTKKPRNILTKMKIYSYI